MTTPLYFDDFEIGQQFASGEMKLHKADALGFAQQYDPQYFHIDEASAPQGPWGKLVASGWQTTAMSMRLKLDTPLRDVAGGLVGLGIDSIKWPRPVIPEDTLHILVTITEKRVSASKPTHGIMKYRIQTLNQNNELVMEMVTAVLVPRA